MAIITEKKIDEILDYLQKSIDILGKESLENIELEGGFDGVKEFLQNQFDVRLENLLTASNSNIHHLESGMKNKIIQRKQDIIKKISAQYRN
ncbi:hypothetical protein [Nitrosopumilus sp.]|uniref:hypothetical protein n=1 Tax=Nitrosopumilus sp. TaxID=2024843 RepID=UPI0029308287|nr:hypothetical protein [Nitrosopumilus sp.]